MAEKVLLLHDIMSDSISDFNTSLAHILLIFIFIWSKKCTNQGPGVPIYRTYITQQKSLSYKNVLSSAEVNGIWEKNRSGRLDQLL